MNREIRRIIEENRRQLEASAMDMRSIFRIMFRQKEQVLCETNDGFRIQKITYGQMEQRIRRTAAALYHRLECRGEYIALEMENCPQWIEAFWAILISGNKPYLVNMRYPQSLTQGILQTLNIRHVLCLGSSKLPGQIIDVQSLQGDYPEVPEDIFENVLAFSSSATSMNEVVCIYTGLQVCNQILNFKQIVKENPRIAAHYKGQLKQLAFLPFYHVFGLFAVYFWFTFFGRTLVFLKDYASDTILKTARRHQVTHIFAVPMLWHTVEQQVWAAAREQGREKQLQKGIRIMTALQNLSPNLGAWIAKRVMGSVTEQIFGKSIMFCINGGSYLRDSAMALLNGIGYCTFNGYGMSEIGITSVELRRKPKDRNRNSIGHPFSCMEYKLDEKGLLWVKGGTLCVKKLVNGQPQETERWFCTGDFMRQEDGHYYIQGRQSDVVIGENGENINPDTVEKQFCINSVRQLSVLGLPGENGQELSMVVQLGAYASQATVRSVRDEIYAINDTLPAASAIRRFYFTTDELAPPTAVKVSRAQLEQKIRQEQVRLIPFAQMQGSDVVRDGQSALQRKVRGVIAKVLSVEEAQVTLDAHLFYDLGATSIQYFSILSALAEEFSITNYNKNDSYCYTLRDICQYIERYL